jgi:hypothetical protein
VTVVAAADATRELRLSVALPAAAVPLPVNVSVQTTAPALVTEGALHDAVNPFGIPDATLIVDPAAPLATVNPPNGVPVTVTVAVPRDNIETDPGATASLIAGACCTCSLIALVNVNPSPLAVTVTVVEVTGAVVAAVSVSVLVPLSDESVSGLLLHVAVTPVGNPLTLRLIAPL